MEQRLQQFLSAENISQSQLADKLGVARASVSHILSGRNKPGFDFIECLAREYPTLNLEWFIMGKGRMYKSDSYPITLFDSPQVADTEEIQDTPHSDENPEEEPGRHIDRVVVFYSDGTFRELE